MWFGSILCQPISSSEISVMLELLLSYSLGISRISAEKSIMGLLPVLLRHTSHISTAIIVVARARNTLTGPVECESVMNYWCRPSRKRTQQKKRWKIRRKVWAKEWYLTNPQPDITWYKYLNSLSLQLLTWPCLHSDVDIQELLIWFNIWWSVRHERAHIFATICCRHAEHGQWIILLSQINAREKERKNSILLPHGSFAPKKRKKANTTSK